MNWRRLTFILLPLFFVCTLQGIAQTFNWSDEENETARASGFSDVEAMRRALGLSLGAVRVYTKKEGFSYAGYGHLIYQNYSNMVDWHSNNLHPVREKLPSGKDQEMTLARGVLFAGYRWSDRLVLNSELRVDRDLLERGYATFPKFYLTTDTPTRVSVDLAYVDYMMSPAFTLRAGVVLVPVGLINEFHTPNEYLGNWSGFGDYYTVPANWHALGFGIAGHKGPFDYRGYVVNGLNAANFTEFGWRDGKEITSDTITHPALVFRIDYNPFPGGVLGGSYYATNSPIAGLDEPVDLKIHATLKELHGELRWKGAFARAQYAKGLLHDSPELNAILGKKGVHGIGKRVVGGYVEGGWNFLWYKRNGTMLMPYMRGEASNPQDALPPDSLALGLVKNHRLDFIIWTIGTEYRPIPAVSIKGEYINMHDEDDIFWKEFRLGASYMF